MYYSENFGLRWRLQVGSGTFFVVLWQTGFYRGLRPCSTVPNFYSPDDRLISLGRKLPLGRGRGSKLVAPSPSSLFGRECFGDSFVFEG